MLLRKVKKLPEGEAWLFELKWDGYRMQVLKEGDRVRLLSRNGADYTRRFHSVAQQVSKLRPRVVHLDGEVIAMDPSGRACLSGIAGWPSDAQWMEDWFLCLRPAAASTLGVS